MSKVRLYHEPRWLQQGDPGDESFFERADLPCLGKDYLFFSESRADVARCRQLCYLCPAFEECARWVLSHFEQMEYGTMAGLDADQRRRIHDGRERFEDWRRTWTRSEYARIVASEYNHRPKAKGWVLKRRKDA